MEDFSGFDANLPGEKSKGYKPFKYKTVETLKESLERYFADPAELPWTMSGLALFLGTTRVTLLDYSHRNGYGSLIRWAKSKVEQSIEKRLLNPAGANAAGIIFNLCNNYGNWHQRQEVKSDINQNVTGKVDSVIKIEFVKPEEKK